MILPEFESDDIQMASKGNRSLRTVEVRPFPFSLCYLRCTFLLCAAHLIPHPWAWFIPICKYFIVEHITHKTITFERILTKDFPFSVKDTKPSIGCRCPVPATTLRVPTEAQRHSTTETFYVFIRDRAALQRLEQVWVQPGPSSTIGGNGKGESIEKSKIDFQNLLTGYG